MADRSMVITWGQVVRGREERALDNFNAVVAYHAGLQAAGRVERFTVTLLSPNAVMGGFMQLLGTGGQLAAVRDDPEFQRLLVESSLIVDDLTVIDGYVDDGLAAQMALFQEAIAKSPQMA
jgi:hypothetical protein